MRLFKPTLIHSFVCQMNTERFVQCNTGINHVEGGWPKDVDVAEAESMTRHRKKAYLFSLFNLGLTCSTFLTFGIILWFFYIPRDLYSRF